MLQAIHDKAKGWVAYAIVGFISIPFALFGINSYLEGGSAQPVAVVNGEEITGRQVEAQLSQLRRQFGRMAASLGDEQLKQMAVDNLINQTLLKQKVEAEGYRASARDVAKSISQAFQTDGQYDPEQYQRFLQTQRRNQGEFENQIREDLTQGQFQQAISGSAFVPKSEAEYYQSLRNQKRDVETFTVKAADFEDKVTISDEQVAEYYEQNKARYMTEEKVKLAYIEVNQSELAEAIEVNDVLLEAYYDENADRYLTPESRNTSHVLIEIQKGKEEEAKAKAQALYDAINSGQRTFEDVAKNDSDDKVAAENEGFLAEVVAGDWGPEFEKVVFALEAGTVSEPVKTEAGYEIIRVNSIKQAVQMSFDDAKSRLEADYRKAEAEKAYLDKADQIQTIAYEQSGDLAPAAQAAGLEIKTTDWVSRNQGDGIANNPKLRELAFSDEVLQERKNSEPLELTESQAVIVRVTDYEASKQKELSEVKDDIVKSLTTQEARTMAASKGAEVLEALKASSDWQAIADAALGEVAAVAKAGKIERVGSKLAPVVVKQVFAMPRPDAGKRSLDSAVLPNGDFVLIAVNAVEDGETALDDNASRLVNNSVGGRELSALLKALRERAEIELSAENI